MTVSLQRHGKHHAAKWLAAVALAALGAACLPTQAQPVYRCEIQGRVIYSNEPCIGARVVDTTPTQGLDKLSGVSRKSPEAQRDEQQKQMSEALYPITGMNHEQRTLYHRRIKLPAEVQFECRLLDARIPRQEKAVRESGPQDKAEAETQLFLSRSQFRKLRC